MFKPANKTQSPIKRLEEDLVEILRSISAENNSRDHDYLLSHILDEKTARKFLSTAVNALSVRIEFKDFVNNATINNLVSLIRASASKEQIVDGRIAKSIIKLAPKKKYYPLSHAQRRMFVLYKLEPDSPFYNMNQVRQLTGKLDISALNKALNILIIRHESFHTNFREINPAESGLPNVPSGETVQIIHNKPSARLEMIDLSTVKTTIRRKETEKIIRKNTDKPFKLETDRLLRAVLIKTGKDKHIFIIVMHHIISDGWSMGVFWLELSEIYNLYLKNKKPDLPPLPIQYRDYAVWEQSKENVRRTSQQEKYWLKELEGDLPVLNLPTDKPRPPTQTYNGSFEFMIINKTFTQKIEFFCRRYNVTLFVFLFTVFNVFLHRITGQKDLIAGALRANRNYQELNNIIGLFLNNLPIRSKINANHKFIEYLKQSKEKILQAIDNSDYSFEQLIEKLNPARDMSRSPIFNVMFLLDEGMFKISRFKGLDMKFKASPNMIKFDLRLRAVRDKKNRLFLKYEYNTDLFHRSSVRRFLDITATLIKNVINNPDAKIADLEVVPSEKKKKLIHKYNNTRVKYPQNKTVHQLFEEQVKRNPNNTAVEFRGKTLTYQQLNKKANQLSRYLREEKKVKRGDVVGIMLDRSFEMIVSVFAIIKVSGAFLQLDPTYPKDRISYMIKNSRAGLVLTQEKYYKKYKGHFVKENINIIATDNKLVSRNIRDKSTTNYPIQPSDTAYIVYTSGTTGNPKGIPIHHRGLVNYLLYFNKKFNLNESDRVLQMVPFSFNPSVRDIFSPLTAGASLHLTSLNDSRNTITLSNTIINDKITFIVSIVPTMLSEIVNYMQRRKKYFRTLKVIFSCGEILDYELCRRFAAISKNKTIIVNQYAPTEYTMIACNHMVRLSENNNDYFVPVGRPINNTQVYVLNENQKIQPVGIPGELYISGDGLVRGYVNNRKETPKNRLAHSEQAQAVFLPHPFIRNRKIYKTGDLARMRKDGEIEILGRTDFQIKIRGFRIEPGEIEPRLIQFANIKSVLVIVHSKTAARPKSDNNHSLKKGEDNPPYVKTAEDKYLVAYYTTKNKRSADIKKLKAHLKRGLPDYMIPAYFIHLKEFPLNSSGKLDRGRLPTPEEKDLVKKEYEPPKTPTEKVLIKIWQEVLGIKKISRHDSFFDLGGHSLKILELHSRLEKVYPNRISVAQLFIYHTITDQSPYLTEGGKAQKHKTTKNKHDIRRHKQDNLAGKIKQYQKLNNDIKQLINKE